MCGIAGIFNLDGSPVNTVALLNMTRIVQYRGPDDEGYALINSTNNSISRHWEEDTIQAKKNSFNPLPKSTQHNLGFGFRRLAILDLSEDGHQPMVDPTGMYCLEFNGELYNYIELKAELESIGHVFRTHSDTEVLIQAYHQWGPECLKKCIGMFAFALWDGNNKQLILARDRLGKKPLNYYFQHDKILWASEEKQILNSGLVQTEINSRSLFNFLRWSQLFDSNETFYQDIQQIPPGSYAIIKDKKFQLHSYWDFPDNFHSEQWSFAKSKDAILHLLNNSIELRLRSDVSVGIALSGGVDSSSICCLARRQNTKPIKTFSVYYEGSKYDERKYIQEVINLGGFDPIYYTADHNLNLEEISRWIYHQDSPTTSASPFSAYQNFRNVRASGITVLLNGQGGDELFGGYPYYNKYLWAEYLRRGKLHSVVNEWIHCVKNLGLSEAIKTSYLSIITYFHSRVSDLQRLEYKKYGSANLYANIETANLQNVEIPNFSFFENALFRSLRVTHMPHMLHWEDRNSMAHSVESRVPFLDHRMVEMSYHIPAQLKIKNNIQKYILRESMRSIVPDTILNRKDKIGFGTPTDVWTSVTLRKEIEEIFSSKEFLQRNFWDGQLINKQFAQHPKSFGTNEVWRILTAELWCRNFTDAIKS